VIGKFNKFYVYKRIYVRISSTKISNPIHGREYSIVAVSTLIEDGIYTISPVDEVVTVATILFVGSVRSVAGLVKRIITIFTVYIIAITIASEISTRDSSCFGSFTSECSEIIECFEPY